MSQSRATFRIISLSNGKSYYPILSCDQGDINQYYNDADEVVPVFNSNNSPILMFLLYDSENNAKPVAIKDDNIVWNVNGKQLAFAGGVSSTTFGVSNESGHFIKMTKEIDGVTVQCLKVVKNLLNINGKSSFSISAVATVLVDNSSFSPSASFPVTIGYGDVSSKKVRIQSPVGYKGIPFVISTKGGFCELEAVVVNSSGTVNSGFTYKWYQQKAGAWEVLAGQTGSKITVSEDMVEGAALFKCEISNTSGIYGTDIQSVTDVSDPWQVYPNPVDSANNPVSLVSYKGSGVAFTFKPYVKHAGSDVKLDPTKVTFTMSLFDSVGTKLNGADSTHNPPFLDTDEKTGEGAKFVIPETFITANNGIDGEITATITGA